MCFIKRFLSILLVFLTLLLPSNSKFYAQEDAETTEDVVHNVKKVEPVLKLAAKFSLPIVILAVVGGVSAIAYYKHRNRSITLSGDVTAQRADELLRKLCDADFKDRKLTIKFENAVIRSGAFHDRTFNNKVVFSGRCGIEPFACKNTKFNDGFEISGFLSENSSLKGARFERDIIVNNVIPKKLFFGANAVLNEGNEYRLPNKVAITCDGTDRSKLDVKNYLEEVYFK